MKAAVYAEGRSNVHDDLAAAREAVGTTWVRAHEATPEEASEVASVFGLHDLEVEDVHGDVRPKVELFDDHTFVLVKTAHLRGGDTTFEEEIHDRPVGIFVGEDWLVTLSPTTIDAVERVWTAVDRGEPRLLRRGPHFTAYRVLDLVVDGYFGVVDEIETDIEHVEDEVMASPDIETLERINSVRRELLSLRRLAWPTRDAVGTLSRGDAEGIPEATEKYYRDLYDHLVQIVDLIETYRDLVGGARDIYLNRLSQSTNEVMKTLTVVATVVLPLTFVVGVYGMNFEKSAFNMPELAWTYGYPAVMIGMGATAVVMLSYFRRREWI